VAFEAVRRKPPGLIRTFYSLQPDGLRRAATKVDGIAPPPNRDALTTRNDVGSSLIRFCIPHIGCIYEYNGPPNAILDQEQQEDADVGHPAIKLGVMVGWIPLFRLY
tara:strand:+ start:5743 stop:6063 length:321 start_codon:yes stop_codon:yes gene_type:complete